MQTSEAAESCVCRNKITRKSTLADMPPGAVVSVRKISAGPEGRKYLLDNGIAVGTDLSVLEKGEDGVTAEDSRGRKIRIPSELAAGIYLQEPLTRHLDPVISGGCCTYGNTAGALDLMDKINEEMFGES